jgi:hypothetical protein
MPAGAGLSLAGGTAAGAFRPPRCDVKTENPLRFTKAAAHRFLLLAVAGQGRKRHSNSSSSPTHVILVYIHKAMHCFRSPDVYHVFSFRIFWVYFVLYYT